MSHALVPGGPSAHSSSVRSPLSAMLAVLAAFMSPGAAMAEDPTATPASESQLGLGLGVGTIRRPYRDIDDETIVLPIVLYENRWVSIAGPVADLKLGSASALSFRLRARFDPGAGYEAEDSPALLGMEERKAGIWLGGAVLWHTGIVDVGAEWLSDASGYSEGQRATLSLQRRFPVKSFSITPRVEAVWFDRENASYYYGVRAQEALAGRPSYEADSTVNTRLGVRVDYRLKVRHALFLDLSATRLDDEIQDSPIVERSSSSTVLLGYAYMF